MLTPNEAHHRKGELKKHWKWYWKEKQDAKKQLELEIKSGDISNSLQIHKLDSNADSQLNVGFFKA